MIKKYKKESSKLSTEQVKKALSSTLEKINFLECIYMGEKAKYSFSDIFKDAAFEERQALCQISSACYSVLRDRKEEKPNV